jgi:hypothetical protein
MLHRLLLATALLAGSLEGQARPVAGLNPKLLRLGTDSLEVFIMRQGKQGRSGTIVDALDTVRVNGELRLQRVYSRTDAVLGDGVDTLVDAFADIRLRRTDSRSDGGGVEHVEWRDGRITGAIEQSGRPARQIDTVAADGVYSSASFDLILRSAPLADGYAITLPAFSGRQGPKTVSAKVAGSETLRPFGATWRLDVDFGGRSATFWITKDSRRLVRQVVHAVPGVDFLIVANR